MSEVAEQIDREDRMPLWAGYLVALAAIEVRSWAEPDKPLGIVDVKNWRRHCGNHDVPHVKLLRLCAIWRAKELLTCSDGTRHEIENNMLVQLKGKYYDDSDDNSYPTYNLNEKLEMLFEAHELLLSFMQDKFIDAWGVYLPWGCDSDQPHHSVARIPRRFWAPRAVPDYLESSLEDRDWGGLYCDWKPYTCEKLWTDIELSTWQVNEAFKEFLAYFYANSEEQSISGDEESSSESRDCDQTPPTERGSNGEVIISLIKDGRIKFDIFNDGTPCRVTIGDGLCREVGYGGCNYTDKRVKSFIKGYIPLIELLRNPGRPMLLDMLQGLQSYTCGELQDTKEHNVWAEIFGWSDDVASHDQRFKALQAPINWSIAEEKYVKNLIGFHSISEAGDFIRKSTQEKLNVDNWVAVCNRHVNNEAAILRLGIAFACKEKEMKRFGGASIKDNGYRNRVDVIAALRHKLKSLEKASASDGGEANTMQIKANIDSKLGRSDDNVTGSIDRAIERLSISTDNDQIALAKALGGLGGGSGCLKRAGPFAVLYMR